MDYNSEKPLEVMLQLFRMMNVRISSLVFSMNLPASESSMDWSTFQAFIETFLSCVTKYLMDSVNSQNNWNCGDKLKVLELQLECIIESQTLLTLSSPRYMPQEVSLLTIEDGDSSLNNAASSQSVLDILLITCCNVISKHRIADIAISARLLLVLLKTLQEISRLKKMFFISAQETNVSKCFEDWTHLVIKHIASKYASGKVNAVLSTDDLTLTYIISNQAILEEYVPSLPQTGTVQYSTCYFYKLSSTLVGNTFYYSLQNSRRICELLVH